MLREHKAQQCRDLADCEQNKNILTDRAQELAERYEDAAEELQQLIYRLSLSPWLSLAPISGSLPFSLSLSHLFLSLFLSTLIHRCVLSLVLSYSPYLSFSISPYFSLYRSISQRFVFFLLISSSIS